MKLILFICVLLSCLLVAYSQAITGDIFQISTNEVTVGVLLEETPLEIRQVLIDHVLAQPDSFWIERAKVQFGLTFQSLMFGLNYVDQPYGTALPYNQSTNVFTFTSSPSLQQFKGRNFVVRKYTFSTTVIAKENTTGEFVKESGYSLKNIGDTMTLNWTLPIEPMLLFQRTAYACTNELYWPKNSIDAEYMEYFYDHTCVKEDDFSYSNSYCYPGRCHCSVNETQNCLDVLPNVGEVDLELTYTHVEWNDTLASIIESVNRYKTNTSEDGADLVPWEEGIDNNWVVYRYYEKDSCEMECLLQPGWRRLLSFDSAGINVGKGPLPIGKVDFEKGNQTSFYPNGQHNLFYWDKCHFHPHLLIFAYFNVTQPYLEQGFKKGFCLQNVLRFTNGRYTSFSTNFPSCENQGVDAGWADVYQAMIPCNWWDITNLDVSNGGRTIQVYEKINPLSWLCEGTINLDAEKNFTWVPTGSFTTSPPYPIAGQSIDKHNCTSNAWVHDNNEHYSYADITPHGHSMVTSKCKKVGQFGEKRDCELNLLSNARTCTPGQNVTLRCSIDEKKHHQVLRVCESSRALGNVGVACRYRDIFNPMLANSIIYPGKTTDITFQCPSARDQVETGGLYSLYYGALLNGIQLDNPVDCYPVANSVPTTINIFNNRASECSAN